MHPHKHCELIKAWADGAEIEARESDTHEWGFCKHPAWVDFYEYRIKPKPDKVVYASSRYNGQDTSLGFRCQFEKDANIRLTFDGETFELKSAEVVKPAPF